MSKGLGLVVFGGLLVFVIISFVTFTDSGQSLWDEVFPGGQREKMEFFEHDLNDNEQMRSLYARNRVAADFGSSVGPVGEVMEKADETFLQYMNAELQRAFASSPQEVDRTQLQYLFQAIQSWPYQPKRFKVRRIAMSGLYDAEFTKASVQSNWLWMPKRMRGDFFPSGTTLRTPTSIFPSGWFPLIPSWGSKPTAVGGF